MIKSAITRGDPQKGELVFTLVVCLLWKAKLSNRTLYLPTFSFVIQGKESEDFVRCQMYLVTIKYQCLHKIRSSIILKLYPLKDRLLISSLSLVITIISQIHKLVKEGLTSSDTTMIGSCNHIHNKKKKNLGLTKTF
jgi:hypothetical protein